MHKEYARLAKSVDYISDDQARQVIGIMLDQLKKETNAVIIDVWVWEPGEYDINILKPYLRRSDPNTPGPKTLALTPDIKSLLAWVVDKKQPIWVDNIPAGAKSGVNRLTGDPLEERYFALYPLTRAFAAVPLQYRSQFRGILTVEVAVATNLRQHHVDTMKMLAETTSVLLWKSNVSEVIWKQTDEAIEDFRRIANANANLLMPLNPHRTGFIARPFKQPFDSVSEIIEKIFKKHRIQATTYDTSGSRFVVSDMLNKISSAHFGISDITSLNGNVLFELGAMMVTGKPLVILRHRSEGDNPLPFDLQGHSYLLYEMKENEIRVGRNLDRTLNEIIESFIEDDLQKSEAFREAREYAA